MESADLNKISAPPSLMKSLMAGFDVISNHIALLLFSVVLDLLLWVGPQVKIVKIFEPLFRQVDLLPDTESAGMMDLLRVGAERINLLSVLRSFPVGIPSLLAGRSPIDTPLESNPIILQLSTISNAAGIWILLIISGVAFGTLYFSMVAQAALDDELNLRQALSRWPRNFGQVLLLTIFWYLIISFFFLPLTCLLSVLLMVGIGVTQFPLIIALFFGALVIWLLIPLFFSPHGIFAYRKPMWESIVKGIRLSRMTFSTTGLLILVVILLSAGLDILWNVPSDSSWLLIIGIAGHAFITAGLLAATFIYYRDADRWLEELLVKREANQAI
jgi:hypothetical protein